MPMLKKTALHDVHERMGARMTEFAGFHMPLWYTKVIEEHMAVRKSVGVFDVSHMGDVIVEGKDATDFLSYILPSDFSKRENMQSTYTAFINQRGILIDDTIVTKINDGKYLVVPNAATANLIYHWMVCISAGYNVNLKNLTMDYTCLAVQGPMAEKTLQKIVDDDLSKVKFFHGVETNIKGVDVEKNDISNGVFITRTGYTGEDGFEIIFPNRYAQSIWLKVLDAGKEFGIKPCGLAARDTLRLEKGLLLSGQDFDPHHEPRTPLEAGISWTIDWNHNFIGKEILENMKKEKKYDLFRGVILKGKGVPRHGYGLYREDKKIGYLTSGTLSPVLNVGVGLGYVKRPYIKVGTEIEVDIRGKRVPAEIRKPKMV